MATVAQQSSIGCLDVNQQLLDSITDSVQSAMDMCGVKVRCVGVSTMPAQESGILTGMIGVHGKVSGFVTLNMSKRFAIHAIEGLLNEKFGELTPQIVDGAGELTNIVVGGIKAALASSEWAFSHITVPSVIVGQNFSVAYARGLTFLTVLFEHDDNYSILMEDRMLNVSVSLLKP